MSITSKSPRKVLVMAHTVAADALPAYSHRCSPKRFTQHQLFACLVLKQFLKTDYRGVTALLADCSTLRQAIGLDLTPHFTTLQKAAKRLLKVRLAKRLLRATVAQAGQSKRTRLAAIDASGFEAQHTSHDVVRRRVKDQKALRPRTYRHFPKLSVVCDCRTHLILSAVPSRGPGPDITQRDDAVVQAWRTDASTRCWPTPAPTANPRTNCCDATWAFARSSRRWAAARPPSSRPAMTDA